MSDSIHSRLTFDFSGLSGRITTHSHSDEILCRELHFQRKDYHQNRNLFCNLILCLQILSFQLWTDNIEPVCSLPQRRAVTVDAWQMLLPIVWDFGNQFWPLLEKKWWRSLHFCSTFKFPLSGGLFSLSVSFWISSLYLITSCCSSPLSADLSTNLGARVGLGFLGWDRSTGCQLWAMQGEKCPEAIGQSSEAHSRRKRKLKKKKKKANSPQ